MSANSGTGRAGTLTMDSPKALFIAGPSGRTDLTVSPHNPFGRGQFRQPHRPAGMQLLGGDADLSTETELLAVGERRRRVDHHRRGIDSVGKPLCGSHIAGHYCLGMPAAVFVDVGDRGVD